MKVTIENAKRKVSFKVNSKSNLSIFEVGTFKMDSKHIVDNVESALEQLKDKWPGGWKNILRLYLKPMKQSKISIPLYYSKINPNDVEVPVEVGFKQSRLDKLNEELGKKSKKFRLDKKTKKLTYVKAQNEKKAPGESKKDKKDKKRKLDTKEVAVKVEPEAEPVEKKKKKKNEEVVVKEEVKEEPAAGKRKKKSTAEPEAVVEAPKKADKKKKAEVVPEEPKAAAKKKTKKIKA